MPTPAPVRVTIASVKSVASSSPTAGATTSLTMPVPHALLPAHRVGDQPAGVVASGNNPSLARAGPGWGSAEHHH